MKFRCPGVPKGKTVKETHMLASRNGSRVYIRLHRGNMEMVETGEFEKDEFNTALDWIAMTVIDLKSKAKRKKH